MDAEVFRGNELPRKTAALNERQGVGEMRFGVEALTGKQLKAVHQATLELMASYGVAIEHAPSRDIFQDNGAQVEGELVKIPSEMVEKALGSAPSSFTVIGRNNRSVTIGDNHGPVIAPAAGAIFVSSCGFERRRANFDDLRNFLRLAQSSEQVDVTCSGILDPGDLTNEEKYLFPMLEAIKLSDKPVLGFSLGKEVADNSIALAEIATDGKGEHYILGVANTHSPMAWDKLMLEGIWSYAAKKQPLIMTCCSMAGFTSPTTLTSTIIQNNAEILAGIVLAQLINPGTPVVYGNTSTITDMMTMNLCIGAPECALIGTASVQLAHFYGIPCRCGGGLNDAKVLDVQAGIESATNLLFVYANGVDFVLHGLGIMESFLGINYEKFIIDEEICGRMKRILRGCGDVPDNALEVIKEVGYKGNFLDHPDTMANFRSEFFRPQASDRHSWGSWAGTKKDVNETAREIWEKRLARFEAPELSEITLKQLNKFVESKIKETVKAF
jgi:trimethylamine--corrinoid protein Co-methyltransferase